jgi:spoIIIJ-associated protein
MLNIYVMAKPENIEMLKNLIETTLEKMTFTDFRLSVSEESGDDGENIAFNINTKESDLLIGQHGVNLMALQHVLRAMARKKTKERLRFSVDINNYRSEKADSLEDLALAMAKQAAEQKRPVVLRPMSAYERRIVHIALSKNNQVQTESIGEGEDRKIVIKPVNSVEG